MQYDAGAAWVDAETLAQSSSAAPRGTKSSVNLEMALSSGCPILPPNPNFFCCCERVHITRVAKALSILYALLYGVFCFLAYHSDHAVAFLTAVLVATSVGGCTLYATFNWSKMCLIPFFLLQIILIAHSSVCFILLLVALINGNSNYVYEEIESAAATNFIRISTRTLILLWMLFILLIVTLFLYSALLFWYEYQFIAEVDRFLKTIRKPSSHGSKDEQNQAGAGAIAVGPVQRHNNEGSRLLAM